MANNKKMKSDIIIKPIGIVHSPFTEQNGTPIQPGGANNVKGEIEIFTEYVDGLEDLEGFSHIILIYHFHKLHNAHLKVKPFMDTEMHGVFSTRSPGRPNLIGISVVKLEEIINNKLIISNPDMLDCTPVIDIKPYIPQIDSIEVDRIGWLENNIHKYKVTKDDGRFK